MVKQTTPLPKALLLAAATVASLPALASAGARDYAQLGQPCMQRYDASAKAYKDISSLWKRSDKCQPGLLSNSTVPAPTQEESRFALTCFVAPNDTGMDPRSGSMDLEGTCLKSTCVGVNDNNLDILPEDKERVTICHRTENELNPWVRMTVDKQAWSDSNNDCGFTTEDYIVKEHGSRNQIEDQMNKGLISADFTTTQEYWEYWERACPFVRQAPEHPHRCCQGPDCCGDAATLVQEPEEEPEEPASPSSSFESQYERKLEGCLPNPQDPFTQDVYVTFMGEPGQEGMTLEERVTASGTTIEALQDNFKNVYNYQGKGGQCVFFQRLVESVTFDTTGPLVPAINKDYLLTGFRVKATVTGWCTGCTNHFFVPSDSCRDVDPSDCPSCIPDGAETGEIVQIAGKDLYPQINQSLNTGGKAAEIFRIQGDVDGEADCGSGELKYLESTGEVVCL
mmetsp:Transcript_2287/g.5213  ORF Transcript_2287/g.5213 Transcript_2287/m.5213 type:complete len:453 (+) Transcript_2287:361-1719(+)|eukprot:CAMPEP_0113639332 /NCGR_PEP_ID=MMETSP0017_2-20120614/20632_1 /TAXON_ID=2856 /ORGANISM="Cylindrotheca closterium" /LENGTH=452 /DNA_ID=CAMNT_0000550537 /DNA_START=349 /DNA_END=1707 /DNA_ORIENTATION=- /assembly_acc=CAM_ASM_000147